MHLGFHYTPYNFLNDPFFIILVMAVPFALVSFGYLAIKNQVVRKIVTGIIITLGVFTVVTALTYQYSHLAEENAAGDKVNAYNLTVLKTGAQEQYDAKLTTNQAQQLLDRYVYNSHTDDYYAVPITVQGLSKKVELHENTTKHTWTLVSVQSELVPVTSNS